MKIGVTKHIIYRRYASKLALLDAVASRELARLDGDVQTPAGSDPQPLTDLKGAARSFCNLCLTPENRAFIKFISAESAFNPDIGGVVPAAGIEPATY